MTSVSSVREVGFLHRPIGYHPSFGEPEGTVEDIEHWKEKERPGVFQRQSYLTLTGLATTFLGIVSGAAGCFKGSTIAKWFGIVLTLLGLGASATGLKTTSILNNGSKNNFFTALGNYLLNNNSYQSSGDPAIDLNNKNLIKEERLHAAEELISTNSSKSINALTTCIRERGNDSFLRKSALGLLMSLNANLALNHLQELITSDDDPAMRVFAIIELSRSKGTEARDSLNNLVKNPRENPDVRKQAAIQLANLGNKDSISLLEEALRSTDDPVFQGVATRSLARIQERLAV